MAKKIVAITSIKAGPGPEDYFEAGSDLPADRFSKEQLAELLDAGSIEIRVVEDDKKKDDDKPVVATPATTSTTTMTAATTDKK